MEGLISRRDAGSKGSFEYLWRLWKLVGIYPDSEYNYMQKAHVIFMVFVDILITIPFVMQWLYMDTFEKVLKNLPVSVSLIDVGLKFLSIVQLRRKLIGVHDLFDRLDRNYLDPKNAEKIKGAHVSCKRLVFFMFVSYEVLILCSCANAANQRRLPFEFWTPYDINRSAWIFWSTFLFQTFSLLVLVLQNLLSDSSVPVYFIMINTHVEIVTNRIENVGWDPEKTQEVNYNELVDCVKDHRTVMKIFDILQETISYTIFIQFGCTILILAMQALLVISYPPTISEWATFICGFLDMLLEIFPCCYFANQFTLLTDRVVSSIYSSNFPDQSPKFKKVSIIFMEFTQECKVLVAGKLVPVTLKTFVSILRMAYSILTLAGQLHKE